MRMFVGGASVFSALPERSAAEKPFHDAATTQLIAAFGPAQDFQPVNTARTIDKRTLHERVCPLREPASRA
jgi:hypothetical protein